MNPLIFRAYDIRGIYGKDFDSQDAERIGKAFATFLKPKTVVVGHDNRESSPVIKKSVIEGLVSSGVRVIDVGMVPTPVLYYAIIKLGASGGIMITASHLTGEWNGFKLCRRNAVALAGEEIQEVRKLVENENFIEASGTIEKYDIVLEYVKEIKEKINFRKKLKVVFDFGNGTVGPVMKKILENENIEPIFLFDEPDSSFPNHWPDPAEEENLKELRRIIKEEKADMGIAFDGDGDRTFFLDETGRIIRGDQALAILSEDVLQSKKEKVLYEVKCSRLLEEWIRKHGGEPIMYKTGHSFIMKKMMEDPAILLAGEMSGHLYFKDFYSIDDGTHAAIRLVSFLTSQQKSLSDLVNELPHYFSTPELRLPVDDEKKFEIIENVKKEILSIAQGAKIIDIDGIRLELKNGWGLLRASNTSPYLIARFEGKTPEDMKKIYDMFSSVLFEYGVPLPPLETGLS
ncbi:MAG: phosphomannomutase/phosphoglucomutase [Candidatus Aenigmarchaeota archaeon]|nr:phosphomannomutase/phosphoglucomutase [Candidatus Aenigmarchaeota archaeon]